MDRASALYIFFPLSQSKDPEWSVLKLSPSLRGGQGLPRGYQGPQTEVGGPDLDGEGCRGQRTDLLEALISGLTPRQGPPSLRAPLPLLPQFPEPQGSDGGALTAWLALAGSLSAHGLSG